MVIFNSYVSHYQRVTIGIPSKIWCYHGDMAITAVLWRVFQGQSWRLSESRAWPRQRKQDFGLPPKSNISFSRLI